MSERPGVRGLLASAWYWTLALVLNNLLNGSPELPYYEPQLNSRAVFLCGVVSWLSAGTASVVVAARAFPDWTRARGLTSAFTFVLIALIPLASLFLTVLVILLLRSADDELLLRPRACALLEKAIAQKHPAERRRLAEEALALDPDNVRVNLFLGNLYARECGEVQKAKVRYDAVIRWIDNSAPRFATRRRREQALKAVLLERKKELA
jgi:hypothetical protein